MRSKLSVLFAAFALVFVAAACNKQANDSATISEDTQKQDSMKNDGMMADDKMMDDEAMMKQHGAYKDYSVATLASEQAKGQKVVLYFYAAWCPFCRAADAAFKANVSQIPPGVTVLKLDYDKESELKNKFGVTYQHTFVQIDNQGSLVTKWVSGDTDLLAKNIK